MEGGTRKMNRAIRKLSGLLLLPVLLAALLLPAEAKAETAAYTCTARLPVSVELNGDSQEEFTVAIEPGPGMDASLPMPEETHLRLAGDSAGAFEGFVYTEPGDYVYTVTQTAGDTEYMAYDTAVYTVVIQVTNGENGGLTYQVYASRDDKPEEKVSEVSFLNTYTPPTEPETTAPAETEEVTDTAPKTGDDQNLAPFIAVLTVAAVVAAGLVILRARSGKQNES